MLKRLTNGALLGLAAAAIVSALCALASAGFAGYARHPLEAAPWLFAVGSVPGAIGGVVLAAWVTTGDRPARRVWLICAAVAFAATVLAGSFGAVTVEGIRRGLQTVNVGGYLIWCWVYAFVLLPLTTPLAWGAARLAWRQNS